jgi:transposase-like protein
MRWTARRKEEVVTAIAQERMTAAEAKAQYGLSDEELAAWQRDYAAHGKAGLRTTWLQRYRGPRLGRADGHRLADLPIPPGELPPDDFP